MADDGFGKCPFFSASATRTPIVFERKFFGVLRADHGKSDFLEIFKTLMTVSHPAIAFARSSGLLASPSNRVTRSCFSILSELRAIQ